jgi:hypothetical protein
MRRWHYPKSSLSFQGCFFAGEHHISDTLDQVVSTRPAVSPELAETALRQLSDPRLSDFDVLSVAKEICSVVIAPRKAARVHSEQIEEDLKKGAVPVDGLAPKLHRKNLSYQKGIKSVS